MQKGDDHLRADAFQAMDTAEDADCRHPGIAVAEAEGMERQLSPAAIDLAQDSRLEAAAAGSDNPLQFVKFVDTHVFHRDDHGARGMPAGERIAHAMREYRPPRLHWTRGSEFVIKLKTACNIGRLSFAFSHPHQKGIHHEISDRPSIQRHRPPVR